MAMLGKSSHLLPYIRSLTSKKGRIEQDAYIIEGRKPIEYALNSKILPKTLILGKKQYTKLQNEVYGDLQDVANLPFSQLNTWERLLEDSYVADDSLFTKLSQASTPSGYLAVLPIPSSITYNDSFNDDEANDIRNSSNDIHPDILCPPNWSWLQGGLVLDGLQDPGNVGALIRSAHAFNMSQIILLNCADVLSHKVVQSAVGSLLDVSVLSTSREQFSSFFHKALLNSNDIRNITSYNTSSPLLALMPTGGHDIQQYCSDLQFKKTVWRSPWLVVGSEARGVSDVVLKQCFEQVTITMAGMSGANSTADLVQHTDGVGSLNAAIAGSIATYIVSTSRQK